MKNITFSAREDAIEKARRAAAARGTTLNEEFREWLESRQHSGQEQDAKTRLENLWQRTGYLKVGKKLTREEMNER